MAFLALNFIIMLMILLVVHLSLKNASSALTKLNYGKQDVQRLMYFMEVKTKN